MPADYSAITETGGQQVTRDQLERAYSRYWFGAEISRGRDVLEVGCGTGIGLGLLRQSARNVVAGDYAFEALSQAISHYGTRVPFVQIDAHSLPFSEETFDVVLMCELIYFLRDAEACVGEAYRILREGGTLAIVSVNREWRDFNPSPLGHKYYSIPEFHELLASAGFRPQLMGAFPAAPKTFGDRVTGFLKRTARRWHLIPRTMESKLTLKRIIFGKLTRLPFELKPDDAPYHAPRDIPTKASGEFRIIYALGHKPLS